MALDSLKVTKNTINTLRLTGNADNIIPVRAKSFNDLINTLYTGTATLGSVTASGTLAVTGATTLSSTLAVTGVTTLTGSLVTSKATVNNRTLTAVNTTAAATLTVVKAGLIAGGFSSTSAAGVTVTLDSVAATITAFAAAGITLATGSSIQFIIDNSQGANTVTLAVDAGTTWAVATPAITGGATLTVSTANKIGLFQLYLTSATTGIISRIV